MKIRLKMVMFFAMCVVVMTGVAAKNVPLQHLGYVSASDKLNGRYSDGTVNSVRQIANYKDEKWGHCTPDIKVVEEIDNLNGITALKIIFTERLEVIIGGHIQRSIRYREKGDFNWVQSPIDNGKGAHSIAWKKDQNGEDIFYFVGTETGEIIRVDDISKDTAVRINGFYRPHDILYNPNDDYFYFIDTNSPNTENRTPPRDLYRFKSFDANSTLADFEKLDLSSILTNIENKAYVRSISLVDGKIYIINSSHGEVVRLDKIDNSFTAVDYTSFKSRNDGRVADAGAYMLTGLILNDVDYYNGYWYGTNFFGNDEKYTKGHDYNIYRFIRWKTWSDFEKGKIEDLSSLIDTYMVPYFITIDNGLLYITAFPVGTPDGVERQKQIYVLQDTNTPTNVWGCNEIQGHHIVEAKETLFAIGRAYRTHPTAIATCNHILNPNQIGIGLSLAIPSYPWSPVPPGPMAIRQFSPIDSSVTCQYVHVVQPRETLTRLKIRYGVSLYELLRVNHLENPNLIYVGQQICIP